MSEKTCIVVGASHAGTALALQLRKVGWQGPIKLISSEAELPYHRPPLSKDFMAGEKTLDQIRLRPEKVFQDNDVELMLATTVEHIDTSTKSVTVNGATQISYEKLALCTGSVVRELPIDRKLANVFYIRTSEDVTALKQQVDAGKRAVIIGAGYIGLEAASVLSGQGVEVTVLEMAERILQRVTSRTMSDYMSSLHTSQGVQIVTSTSVTAIEGQPAVEKVICDDGSEYFADIVIIGIGVLPHSELAIAAGLEVTDGVLVNEFCQTSDPDIYAAGDCTHHPSNTYDRLLRLESVQNANDQGRIAAANICGNQIPYDVVPWFWSDQYKVKLQMAGINSNYDKVICRGDSENTAGAGFALFYLKNGTLIAVDCVDRPKEFMVSKQLIKHRARLDPGQLLDESVEPIDFTS